MVYGIYIQVKFKLIRKPLKAQMSIWRHGEAIKANKIAINVMLISREDYYQ